MDNQLPVTRPHQPIARGALDRAALAVVRYYAAIRLSAGAATALLPLDLRPERPPIVRASQTQLPDGFDRREVIMRSGRPLVITVDAVHAEPRNATRFSPN